MADDRAVTIPRRFPQKLSLKHSMIVKSAHSPTSANSGLSTCQPLRPPIYRCLPTIWPRTERSLVEKNEKNMCTCMLSQTAKKLVGRILLCKWIKLFYFLPCT